MAESALGREFGVRVLEALGIETKNVLGFSMHFWPDDVVRVRVEYLAPRGAMDALAGDLAEYAVVRRAGHAPSRTTAEKWGKEAGRQMEAALRRAQLEPEVPTPVVGETEGGGAVYTYTAQQAINLHGSASDIGSRSPSNSGERTDPRGQSGTRSSPPSDPLSR